MTRYHFRIQNITECYLFVFHIQDFVYTTFIHNLLIKKTMILFIVLKVKNNKFKT